MDGPKLSVVVPTRNEADNVEALVQRLAAVLAGVPAEVVFIDDSTDETPATIESLSARAPAGLAIRLIHRPAERQTGLGSAAAEGLRVAGGHLVAVMDGDLQHPPEVLRHMIEVLERDQLDVVVASRYVPGGSARGLNGPARVFVSWASKLVAQLLFREACKTSDPLSGYFLCRRSAIAGLEFRPIGFKILLEVLVCAHTAAVGDVPLAFDKRHAGKSNASMAQGLAFLRHLWSLVVHVPGSARLWKYAAVGAAGLAIFLGLLGAGRGLGLSPYLAWAAAFIASLFLNWQLNRLVTFADVPSPFTPGRGRPIYLPVAVVGGAANLLVFAVLVAARADVLVAGLAGAAAAMVINFVVQRGLLSRPPRVAGGTGGLGGAIVERVAALVRADVHLVASPVDRLALETAAGAGRERPPQELLRAAQTQKPLMLAEAPSHKAQARSDIGVSAWMAVPVVEGDRFLGLLVLHRDGRPFGAEELDAVLRALRSDSRERRDLISPLLARSNTASG